MTYRVAMAGACPFPAPQGSQTLMLGVAEALRARGDDVRLVVYGHGAGPDPAGFRIDRARRLPGSGRIAAGPYPAKPLLDLLLAAKLRHVLREGAIDIIHAHNYEALIAALLVAGRIPVVYHAHNLMEDELPHFLPGGRMLGRWLDGTFPKRAQGVIALHQPMAGHLIGLGCDSNRVRVIPPPIDTGLFEEPAVDEATPPVLYLGNLDVYQNLGCLYKAMRRVRRDIPGARLIIGTAAPHSVPDAEFLRVDGMETLRKALAMDAVVACPRVSWSGYPIKLVNAMAAGKAVVACQSAAHGIRDEETGLIVPDNDAEAFAAALIRLMTQSQTRLRLGQNARKATGEGNAPAQIADAIAQLYGQVLQ